jgi:hypothetical protein
MSSLRRDGSFRSSIRWESSEQEPHKNACSDPLAEQAGNAFQLGRDYNGEAASVFGNAEGSGKDGPPPVAVQHKLQRQLSRQITKKLSSVVLTEEDHKAVEVRADKLVFPMVMHLLWKLTGFMVTHTIFITVYCTCLQ